MQNSAPAKEETVSRLEREGAVFFELFEKYAKSEKGKEVRKIA